MLSLIYPKQATDPDLNDAIRYVIKPGSLVANGENLDGVLATAFGLNIESGVLLLNFGVLATMKGFIEFQIQAFDLGRHANRINFENTDNQNIFSVDNEDTCDVKIFIISESNRVKFVFLNDKETVDEHRERVSIQIFKSKLIRVP